MLNQAHQKLLPMDEDAERCVLSAILQDGNALHSALSILSDADFVSTRHRLIFKAMVTLSQKQVDVDILTVVDYLRCNKQWEEVGGMDYLDQLEDWMSTPQTISHFSKAVKNKSILRDLSKMGERLFNAACSEQDPEDMINEMQDRIYKASLDLQGSKSNGCVLGPAEIAQRAFDSAVNWMENPGKARGLQTGFTRLDSTINGLKDLNIISASTGIGKTAFALNLAINIGVNQNIPILYINHEMNVDEVTVRMQGILSGVPLGMVLSGRYNKRYPFDKIPKASEKIKNSKFYLTDNKPKNINAVITLIRKYKARHDIQVAVVDYLGEVEMDKLSEDENSEYITYGRWTQQLKDACVSVGVKLILLVQLNRQGEESPNKNKVGGSWKIAQKADVFLILGVDSKGRFFLKVDKNRNGPHPKTIDLNFDKETQRITEVE